MRNLFKRVEQCGLWIGPATRSGGAGFLTALWTGLILAETGRFSAWVALSAAVAAALLVWRHYRRKIDNHPPPDTSRRGLLAAVVLALLSLAFTVPPSEIILGGWDPGVYVHTAAVLAHDGVLLSEAPDLAALDAADRTLIGRQGQDAWEPFPGMRMLPDGRISPQFYHLYPVLMALVWAFGGMKAALLVNPLLNVLSILLVYQWACRWVRPRWAFAAALLLALNPAQVWQAGFPTSELLAQCLLLIGLLAADRALSGRTKDKVAALMAGSAFGLMMLAKYEAILFVVPFSVLLLFGLRDRSQRRSLLLLLGTMAVFGLHVGAHQILFSSFYHPMGNWVLPGLAMAAVAALLIAAIAIMNPRPVAEESTAPAGRMRWLRIAAVAGFAVWVFLAWYVRPHLTIEGRVLTIFTRLIPGLSEAGWFAFLAGRNAGNFWYLQSLFGTAGLIAALAGVGIMLVRKRTIRLTAWLMASLVVLIALMTQISHEPFMMFVARRMVPVILPLLCLGGAVLCDRCEWVLRKHPRQGIFAGVLILALSLSGTFRGTAFLATHREWPGLVNWYDQVRTRIPSGALVYSDQPGVAAPLRFIYGIQAYELYTDSDDQRTAAMAMMMKKAEKNTILWLTQSNVPELYAAYAEPTSTLPLSSVILGTTKHTVPRYIRPRGGLFKLYRIKQEVVSSSVPDE